MNKSESIKNISLAMIKVQEEIKGMTPDAKNPFFKSNYITLDGILEYVRPILSKNQIWLVQEADGLDGHVSVKTSLYHSSGEFMETDSLEMIPIKNDPQVLGSLITYLKRYQLAALMGISSEVDDDGNKATGSNKNNAQTNTPKDNKNSATEATNLNNGISESQVNRLFAIASSKGYTNGEVKSAILTKYKIVELAKLTKEQYDTIVKGYEGAVSKAVK